MYKKCLLDTLLNEALSTYRLKVHFWDPHGHLQIIVVGWIGGEFAKFDIVIMKVGIPR